MVESGRQGVVVRGQPQVVVFVGVHGGDAGGAVRRYAFQRFFCPVFGGIQNDEAGFHVFEFVQDEVVFGPGDARKRGVRVGGEERDGFAFARLPVGVVGDEVAAGRVGFAVQCPVFAQGDVEPVAIDAFVGGVGDVDFVQCAVRCAFVEFVVVEVDNAADEVAVVAGGVVVGGGDEHVVFFATIDGFGVGKRCAALPQAGFARVAGGGHAARAEVGLHEDVVFVYPAH